MAESAEDATILRSDTLDVREQLDALAGRAGSLQGAEDLGAALDLALDVERRIVGLLDRADALGPGPDMRGLLGHLNTLDDDVDALICSLEERLAEDHEAVQHGRGHVPRSSDESYSPSPPAIPRLGSRTAEASLAQQPMFPPPGPRHQLAGDTALARAAGSVARADMGLDQAAARGGTSQSLQEPPDGVAFRAPSAIGRHVRALYDFDAQKPDDLGFKEGDVFTVFDANSVPNWWLVEGNDGSRGYVPENYFVFAEEPAAGGGAAAAAPSPWKKMRALVSAKGAMSQALTLSGMPAGCRMSVLAAVEAQSDYKPSAWLAPHLDCSGLGFRDLHLDHATGGLRATVVPISRSFSVIQASDVPVPQRSAKFSITHRHVRVSLFDKEKFVSNILTLRAAWQAESPNVWRFDRPSSTPGSTANDCVCLARSSSENPDLHLLFELSVTAVHTEGGTREEISCGWAQLPLYQHDGHTAASKVYDLRLHGGTPFEHEVMLGAVSSEEGGKRQSRFGKPQNAPVPSLRVKLTSLKKQAQGVVNSLPEVFVTQLSSVPLISQYREVLCDVLLRETRDPLHQPPVSHALLEAFPSVLNMPLVLNAFKTVWNDALGELKASQKKNPEHIHAHFVHTFTQKVFPLLHLHLPVPASDPDSERANYDAMLHVIGSTAMSHIDPLLPFLQSSTDLYEPFDAASAAFSPIAAATRNEGVE